MPTEKKERIVAQLTEDLTRSNVVILTSFRGLNMKDLTTVRRNLDKAGIGYHVVKNTLLRLALSNASITGLDPYTEGPTAVAFAYEDPVASCKAVQEQLTAFPTIKVKGGWMQGQVLSPQGVQALATLPPRPVLLGQLVGMVQSPAANLVGILASSMRQLLYVLQQRSEQSAAEGKTAEEVA